MCDGVTQGTPGMELSLFSRDAIAMATAVALSHDVFDGALLLGVCDKIVPGLLIGALHYGHLPCVFVPAGPMGTGLSNKDKSKVREQYAQGLVGRDELLKAESAAYHSPGTCTFYGTANSNQMLLEAMGLHVPGAAFESPGTEAREAFTRQALRTVLDIGKRGNRFTPIGKLVDERCIVNAMVALLATGGSTNHLIHWVAIARSAGILIDWTDFDELSSAVPLLARVYPNGDADVNQFQAAGGPAWILRELLAGGFMHADVMSVNAGGIAAGGQDAPAQSGDESVLRPVSNPFSPTGGLRLLQGRLGRAVIKVSAVPEDRHIIEAPARVFDSQEALARRLQCGRGQPGHGRRGALSGPAGQWHARAAQAHAPAGRAAKPGLQGCAGHRWPHERRIGQGACCHPRYARGTGRWPVGQGARWRHGAGRCRGRHAGCAGR